MNCVLYNNSNQNCVSSASFKATFSLLKKNRSTLSITAFSNVGTHTCTTAVYLFAHNILVLLLRKVFV